MPRGGDLKARVRQHQGLEFLRQPYALKYHINRCNIAYILKHFFSFIWDWLFLIHLAYVFLQPDDTVIPNDKPQFQSSKSLG